MHPIVVALTGLLSPGFAHGLTSQRRAMAIWLGVFALTPVAVTFTVWAAYLLLVVYLGSAIHAAVRYRRICKLGPPPQLSWLYPTLAFVATIAIALATRLFVAEAFKIPASSMYPALAIGDHIYIDKLSLRWRAPERGEIIVFRQPCEPARDYVKRIVAIEHDTIEIRCGVLHVNGKQVPSTLVNATDSHEDYDEGMDERGGQWFRRGCSRYRETLGDHAYDIFHDIDRPKRDEARRAGGRNVVEDTKDFPGEINRHCGNAEYGEARASAQRPGTVVVTGDGLEACKPHRHYVVPEGHVFVMGDNRSNSNDSRYWGSVPVDHIKGRMIGIWLPFRRIGAVE
jgi:signal peptidase I